MLKAIVLYHSGSVPLAPYPWWSVCSVDGGEGVWRVWMWVETRADLCFMYKLVLKPSTPET